MTTLAPRSAVRRYPLTRRRSWVRPATHLEITRHTASPPSHPTPPTGPRSDMQESRLRTILTNSFVEHEVALPPADDIVVDGNFKSGNLPSQSWSTAGSLPSNISGVSVHTGAASAAVGEPYWGADEILGSSFNPCGPRTVVDHPNNLHSMWCGQAKNGDPNQLLYSSKPLDGSWSAPLTFRGT